MKLHIDVFADLACPWCYIGEKRLERALSRQSGLEVELLWHPFQLNPEMPAGGIPWREFVDQKFGGAERAGPIFQQVVHNGAGEGITFDFERMPKAPNTADAHRLILWAGRLGKAWPMSEALFQAYFTDAKDVTDHAVLASVAAQLGLDEAGAQAFLGSDELAAEVQASQQAAEELGIRGVPFFILNRRVAVSGAQSAEHFEKAIQTAMKS